MFLFNNKQRKGHVEFIYAAMEHMEEFGVHRDLETYKALLNIFPKGKMIAENTWQLDMYHFPKHQYCALELLDQMEYFVVFPDKEVAAIVKNAFGGWSYVGRKLKRMMYWMPKFKNQNPYFIPRPTPTDSLELAKWAVRMMCRDPTNELSVWLTRELSESKEDTWIVSGQSPSQSEHIDKHDIRLPLYVDGPFRLWVRDQQLNYFVLLADRENSDRKIGVRFEDLTPETAEYWKSWRRDLKSEYPSWRRAVWAYPSMHEQADGTILAICATGTSSKDSLALWISFLQKANPKLSELNVLFRLKHAGAEVISLEDFRREHSQKSSVITKSNLQI